jgi:two-component system, chemotaxis family, chemotaxis protein CheY
MISLENDLAGVYLAESCEHVAVMETELAALEAGEAADEEPLSRVFRAVHAVRGGARFFELSKVRELAQHMEDLLAAMLAVSRSHKIFPAERRVQLLRGAAGQLRAMIAAPGDSNQADIANIVAALARSLADLPKSSAGKRRGVSKQPAKPTHTLRVNRGGRRLRILLAEDDFACRMLLQTFLARYGECHVTVNGREAVEAFRAALDRALPYDLVCMDIMMPEMDGREAVRQVRALEESRGTLSTSGAKIIMTTAVDDVKEVILCFKELCDAYLMKPIDLADLVGQMKACKLVK